MKTTGTIVTALAATALLAAGSGLFACKKKEPETIKIGVILPLTGDGASLGKDAERGIRLALVQAEKDGLFEPGVIQFIVEDSKGEAKTGVSAYRKLVDQDGVRLIIGDLFSAPTLAIAPFAESDKVMLFSPGASNPKITTAGDYVFRNYPSDDYEGTVMAEYLLKGVEVPRVAVVYPTNDYGVGLKNVFEKKFRGLGGSITISEGFLEGQTDFRSIITKVKESKAEAVYIPGYYQSVALFAKQAKEYGLGLRLFSSVGVEDPKIFDVGGTAVGGIRYTAPGVDLGSSEKRIADFRGAYKTAYNEVPNFPAAHGYDTTMLMLKAIAEVGPSPGEVKNYLYGIRGYPGVTGTITFDTNGDVIKPFFIKEIRQGEFRIIKR